MSEISLLIGPEDDGPKEGKLTDQQRKEFHKYEEEITQHETSIGDALYCIHRQRLYRETHSDFDAYLADRWPQIDRSTAYRRIAASAVRRELRQHAPDLPQPSQDSAQVLNRSSDPVGLWAECVERGMTSKEGVEQVLAGKVQPAMVAAVGNPKAAKTSNKVELHVPAQFEPLVQELFGFLVKPQVGRNVLRRSVKAEEAADLVVKIGECLRDNNINPFSLRIAL